MIRIGRPNLGLLLLGGAALLALSACDPDTTGPSAPLSAPSASAVIPAQGTAGALDIGNWNVEWFGASGFGPSDKNLQQANVRDVLLGADMDIWGLEEVVDSTRFRNMINSMPGYAEVLANSPFVVNGPQFYSDFSNTEQKVALVYKTSVASVTSAKVILTANDFDFAGRPPVEFKVHLTLGAPQDIVIIVLHNKAGADSQSWQRRQNASVALKNYLDTTYPTQKVWVIGDWNDDVDTSILSGSASPFVNFVNDAARYTYPTKALSDAHVPSETGYPDFIDHQMNTNETFATYVAGSAQAFRADNYIANYSTTTSDHYPVMAAYTVPSGGPNQAPTASFTSSCTGLGCVFTDRSTDADGTIASWSWTFGDGGTSTVASPSHTYATAGTYTVSLTVTDNAGATGTTSAQMTVTSGGGSPAQMILNEILANEQGSNTAGEAVELVNIGGTAADVGGWTISDATSVRHTFAAGTVVQPGKSISVYGNASAIPAGITAVGASTGTLSLANGGDSVILKNASGSVVQQFAYSSSLASSDGVSMNRSPDLSATGAWVKHNTISTLKQSIGKKADGSTF